MQLLELITTVGKGAWRNASSLTLLGWRQGRRIFIRRAIATTKHQEATAKLQEIAVQERQSELRNRDASSRVALVRQIEQIQDPLARRTLLDSFIGEIRRIEAGESTTILAIMNSPATSGLIGPGSGIASPNHFSIDTPLEPIDKE